MERFIKKLFFYTLYIQVYGTNVKRKTDLPLYVFNNNMQSQYRRQHTAQHIPIIPQEYRGAINRGLPKMAAV